MSDSVDRVFVHALNTVKRIPRTGTARPPASERLKLYGLYKQSMEGDVEGVMDRPVGNTADVYAECEKWDAWFAQRGLSRTEAKRRYISTLIETMHRYASQTSEARELVSELEFVWDQVKINTSVSSASSSPVQTAAPPFTQSQPSYASIGGRLARSDYDHLVATARGDSRLRVLSPVSQPEEVFQRRSHVDRVQDEDEEEEEYAEAQDNLDEGDDDHDNDDASYNNPPDEGSEHDADEAVLRGRGRTGPKKPPDVDSRRWRRRVEQALTKMTAEIAAVREQMEARAVAHRRRNSIWAWLKWLVWVTLRQVIWDLAILGMLLIWMRLRGDRRLESKLKVGWTEVKTRLSKLKGLRRVSKVHKCP
ncbi:acyl CoA binding protein-domain-containing protein [Aspergillus bertholletiae]|uniref:Acyl CoA binding protein-domain-containing protein n=1 Tax=Aspergillus bertholletiae TaxID=1226010 RepID=A0A5N7BAS8_9EURO|nr:acyl CoA binding protein-domain-containing protein [Aspergillus bertholletiae]